MENSERLSQADIGNFTLDIFQLSSLRAPSCCDASLGEHQIVSALIPIYIYCVSGLDLAIEQHQSQTVLNLFLNQPLERASAIDRVEAFPSEFLHYALAYFQLQIFLLEDPGERANLQLNNASDQFGRQPAEDDHIVNPVEKLGPESLSQIFHYLRHGSIDIARRLADPLAAN